MVMQHLIFYTKPDCHLCEEAYQIVLRLIDDISFQIETVDISLPHNAKAATTYGERIPVLVRPDLTAELNWPFSEDDLRAYLTL